VCDSTDGVKVYFSSKKKMVFKILLILKAQCGYNIYKKLKIIFLFVRVSNPSDVISIAIGHVPKHQF
jgi:hypothetical protein